MIGRLKQEENQSKTLLRYSVLFAMEENQGKTLTKTKILGHTYLLDYLVGYTYFLDYLFTRINREKSRKTDKLQ